MTDSALTAAARELTPAWGKLDPVYQQHCRQLAEKVIRTWLGERLKELSDEDLSRFADNVHWGSHEIRTAQRAAEIATVRRRLLLHVLLGGDQ